MITKGLGLPKALYLLFLLIIISYSYSPKKKKFINSIDKKSVMLNDCTLLYVLGERITRHCCITQCKSCSEKMILTENNVVIINSKMYLMFDDSLSHSQGVVKS